MCLWNSRSIVNKLSHFYLFVYSSSLNVIALTETWLHDSVCDNEVLPSHYNIYRCDHSSRGGGVLLAIHSYLPSSLLNSPSDLEVVCVLITVSRPVLFCLVYVPPHADFLYYSKLIVFFDSILCLGHFVIILGDFNAPDICWETLSGLHPSSFAVCEVVVANGFEQLVTFPTHTGGNILDLDFCAYPHLVQHLCHLSTSLLSTDHCPIYFELDIPVRRTSKQCVSWFYDSKKTDFEGLNSFLLDYNFSDFYDSSDVEFSWSFFKTVILTGISLFTPRRKVTSAGFPCWFTPGIRHQLNKVHSLRKRYKSRPSSLNLFHLTSAECILQLSMLDACVSYEEWLVWEYVSHNGSRIFGYIRSLSGRPGLPSVMSYNLVVADTPSEIASLFNQYFHLVYNSNSSSVSQPPPTLPEVSLCSIDISVHDLFKALCSLNCGKAGIARVYTIHEYLHDNYCKSK